MKLVLKKKNYLLTLITITSLFTGCLPERDNPWDDKSTIEPKDWAPSNLEFSVNSLNSITLSWEHNTEHFEGYKIDRKEGSGEWIIDFITQDSGNKTFTDNSVTLTNTYTYRVCAYAGSNNSAHTENAISPLTPLTITTNQVTNITDNSTISGGNITSEGGLPVTARGVVWSTYQNPTIASNQGITFNGKGIGTYTSNLTGLISGTTYYVQAYATNNLGTAYGNQVNFTTSQPGIPGTTITDVDGNLYKTILFNGRIWMKENLKTTKYRDGTPIPLITDNGVWAGLSTPAYCWYNNNQSTYGNSYGALYNFYTVNTGNLCPTGWHVPTDVEWTALTDYAGGISIAGIKLKATIGWINSGNGTDEFGFSALPGGNRLSHDGTFSNVGGYGYWWSSIEYNTSAALNRYMSYNYGGIYRIYDYKNYGFSVRCVRDY